MTDTVGPDDLEEAATRIAAALGDDGVLAGALAVAAWGYVRATDDIDFVARLPAALVVERLKAAGISSRSRFGAFGWRVTARTSERISSAWGFSILRTAGTRCCWVRSSRSGRPRSARVSVIRLR